MVIFYEGFYQFFVDLKKILKMGKRTISELWIEFDKQQ